MERIGKDLSLRSIEKQAFFICEKLLGNYEETRLRKTKQRDYKRRNSEIHVQTKDEESVAEVHCHKCRETAIHPGKATNVIAMGAPQRGMSTVLKFQPVIFIHLQKNNRLIIYRQRPGEPTKIV